MATVNDDAVELEQLLELDDGVERWLIAGELRERRPDNTEEDSMTRRNPDHVITENAIGECIKRWLRTQPRPRGRSGSGEVSCILSESPATRVGIDVAYFSPGVWAAQPPPPNPRRPRTTIYGVPTLAVEILSPSDKVGDVDEKVLTYLDAGVPHVWVVSPTFQTVTVYRPGRPPELCSITGVLTAEPEMPGLSVPLTEIFED